MVIVIPLTIIVPDVEARAERERDELAATLSDTLAAAKRAALAASGDIARLRQERDGVREELARQAAECEDLRATAAMHRQQLREITHDLEHVAAERDKHLSWWQICCGHRNDLLTQLAGVQAELASALVELDHLRAERDAAYDAVVPANPPANRG